MTQTTTGNYAKVNGLNLYYERSGEQATVPLILLHGGFGATSEFAHLIPALSAGREVIAIDLQGTDTPLMLTGPWGTITWPTTWPP